ncbi:MAG: hypothetical protein ACI9LM_002040 [Alteromonadaceae bacterium]|jgi:hypothetical protein
MQINTSVSQNTPLVKHQKNDVQKAVPQSQAALRIELERPSAQPRSQRFDIEELSLITQESQSSQIDLSSNKQTSDNHLGNNATKNRYDQPSQHNKSAVAAYQSVGNQSKKEGIQQVFGVDLFA